MKTKLPKWYVEEMKRIEKAALVAGLPGCAAQVGIARRSPSSVRVIMLRDRGEHPLNPPNAEVAATVAKLYGRAADAVVKLLAEVAKAEADATAAKQVKAAA